MIENHRLIDSARSCGLTDEQRGVLLREWRRGHRVFSTELRLYWMIDEVRRISGPRELVRDVELAVWFLGAGRGRTRAESKDRGADMARKMLPGPRGEKIARMVLSTKCRTPVDKAEALLCDVELAFLGAPADKFAAFERQIRSEYSFLREAEYRARRAAAVNQMLRTPLLFRTPTFQHLRVQARENLERLLARLDPKLLQESLRDPAHLGQIDLRVLATDWALDLQRSDPHGVMEKVARELLEGWAIPLGKPAAELAAQMKPLAWPDFLYRRLHHHLGCAQLKLEKAIAGNTSRGSDGGLNLVVHQHGRAGARWEKADLMREPLGYFWQTSRNWPTAVHRQLQVNDHVVTVKAVVPLTDIDLRATLRERAAGTMVENCQALILRPDARVFVEEVFRRDRTGRRLSELAMPGLVGAAWPLNEPLEGAVRQRQAQMEREAPAAAEDPRVVVEALSQALAKSPVAAPANTAFLPAPQVRAVEPAAPAVEVEPAPEQDAAVPVAPGPLASSPSVQDAAALALPVKRSGLSLRGAISSLFGPGTRRGYSRTPSATTGHDESPGP